MVILHNYLLTKNIECCFVEMHSNICSTKIDGLLGWLSSANEKYDNGFSFKPKTFWVENALAEICMEML